MVFLDEKRDKVSRGHRFPMKKGAMYPEASRENREVIPLTSLLHAKKTAYPVDSCIPTRKGARHPRDIVFPRQNRQFIPIRTSYSLKT
jgi:hypothetical protein